MPPDRLNISVMDALPPLLPRLWRFAFVLCRSHDIAEDLVQATCVRALERQHQFTGEGRIEAWVFSILSSIWKNHLRSERVREGAGRVDAEDVLVFDGENTTETNIFFRQVLEQIHDLPEAQRTTVLLVYGEGLSYAEAATVLEIPIGTVMSRLAAARKALAHLKGAEPEHGGRTQDG